MDQGPTGRGVKDQTGKPRGLGFIRVAWFTVAVWLSAILFISVAVAQQAPADGANGTGNVASTFSTLTLAAIASLACIPLAFFVRTQTYKKHWRGDRITLHGYTLGCLAVFVGVQPPALLSLLAVFETHRLTPQLLPLIAAILVHLANWPHGRPMLGAPVRFGEPKP